jgi:hypothetical protein
MWRTPTQSARANHVPPSRTQPVLMPLTLLPAKKAEAIAIAVIDPYTDTPLKPETKIKQLLKSLDQQFIALIHQDIKSRVKSEGYFSTIGFGGLATGAYGTIAELGDEIHSTSFK